MKRRYSQHPYKLPVEWERRTSPAKSVYRGTTSSIRSRPECLCKNTINNLTITCLIDNTRAHFLLFFSNDVNPFLQEHLFLAQTIRFLIHAPHSAYTRNELKTLKVKGDEVNSELI